MAAHKTRYRQEIRGKTRQRGEKMKGGRHGLSDPFPAADESDVQGEGWRQREKAA
jgi:hypothetical protein